MPISVKNGAPVTSQVAGRSKRASAVGFALAAVVIAVTLAASTSGGQTRAIAELPLTTRPAILARAHKLADHLWTCGQSNLHASCARWLHDRGVALLGSDGVNDLLPSPVAGVVQPIHQITLVALGVRLFDNCDLEALAKAAAERQRCDYRHTGVTSTTWTATTIPPGPRVRGEEAVVVSGPDREGRTVAR